MIHVGIAEDDFRIADIHRQLIEQIEGFSCRFTSGTAKELLETMEHTPVDVLLLDIYLPDQLGTDILGQILDRHDVYIIIISASNDLEHVQKAYRSGVIDYIIKPASPKRLEESLKKFQALQAARPEGDLTQEEIDRYFSSSVSSVPVETKPEADLPKGIDTFTLDQVKDHIQQAEHGVTADEMAFFLGASRTTAHRYFKYLLSTSEIEVRPIYGIVGRPERRYFKK